MKIRKLSNESEFSEFVSASGTVNCVKFGAEWCGPCKMLDKTLESVADVPEGVRFAFADVEELPSVAESLGIMNVPVISVFRGCDELDRIVGLCTWRQILGRIESVK